MKESRERRRNFIHIKSRQRTPDYVRKAGPMAAPRMRDIAAEQDYRDAIDEWAEDYAGTHSVFKD